MKQEIKNAIKGKCFWGAFAIMLLCLLGLSVPEWICSVDWGSQYRQSALQQSVSGVFLGGVMLLLPFCACLPYATNQVDELRSSVMQWKLIRSSIKKYALSKIISTSISGGTAIAFAFILHSLVWNFIAQPCNPTVNPYHEILFSPRSLYATWYSTLYGLPMYASLAVGMFIAGAAWATVALAISVWIPDRLLTVTIPTCICYLLAANVLQSVFGLYLPHPAVLYNDALTAVDALYALLEYVSIFIIATGVYIIGLKRRGQDA